MKKEMKDKIISCVKIAYPFVIFLALYMVFFYIIRMIKVEKFYHPCMALDYKIPFIKFFVIPYLSWLGWIPFIWLITLYNDEKMYKKTSYMMMISMTSYMLLSLVFPTSLSLRPVVSCNDIFCRLTKFLYSLTPETYVFPSLHVFHSLVALYAIYHSKGELFKNTAFRIFGLIWTMLICLSTVFVKQHSIIDAMGGLIYFIIMWKCFEIYEKRKLSKEIKN